MLNDTALLRELARGLLWTAVDDQRALSIVVHSGPAFVRHGARNSPNHSPQRSTVVPNVAAGPHCASVVGGQALSPRNRAFRDVAKAQMLKFRSETAFRHRITASKKGCVVKNGGFLPLNTGSQDHSFFYKESV